MITGQNPPFFLARGDGVRLAYRFTDGAGPLLVFLPGYRSDMEGMKAQAVFAHAHARGQACLLLDYSGCGLSEGRFEDGTLDVWRDDVLMLINHVWATGAFIPVGSSMGGWLALLTALARPERVSGLVGIAAAPDFTDWGFTEEQKSALQRHGRIIEPSDYDEDGSVTTLKFWKSGEANRLLDSEIPLSCPARFIHGMNDQVVPWRISLRAAELMRSDDVHTILVKHGDHRLSGEGDIAALLGLINGLLEQA